MQGGLVDSVGVSTAAAQLIAQDANEVQDSHGQNVRDAFPLGDVFIDATSRAVCEKTLERFVILFFGGNQCTPTYDEYGMYLAKTASLRSQDLSRQVGAALFCEAGQVLALGCNEVPKAGGGTYWESDQEDARDFAKGKDPNDQYKKEVLIDVLDRLLKGGNLSPSLAQLEHAGKVADKLLAQRAQHSIKDSKVMDLLEFGRIIHAEMSTITDAARRGRATQDARLYCTTFPCHMCAKHIVSSGIKEVIYLEPYPKSYAGELHDDSIELEAGVARCEGKVRFRPFIGVSPFRYRELFEKRKRKTSDGRALEWNNNVMRPMVGPYDSTYASAETRIVNALRENMDKIAAENIV